MNYSPVLLSPTPSTSSTCRVFTASIAFLVLGVALLVAPQDAHADSLKLYLNDPVKRPAPYNKCDREICSSLLKIINGAEKTIDFAIYGMRNQEAILRALENAKKRGVKIRGVVDRDADGKNYYSSTELMISIIGNVDSDLKAELALAERAKDKQERFGKFKPACERPVGFDGPLQCLGYDLGDKCLITAHASREAIDNSGAIMHNKFFIVDGRHLWTGSTNVSDSGTGGYNSNLVTLLDSPKVAAWYTREFEAMYVDGKYHDFKESHGTMKTKISSGVNVQVLFSPQDKPITNGVRPLLQKARKSIDVGIFFLTHKGIARDLINAKRRGVKVRVIMDATASKNGYAKHEIVRAAGIPVKIENWGGKMHMKSAVIDGETVITGSMNWTSAGERGNDENTIIITSKKHAKQYTKYFNHLWRSIPAKWLEDRPDPESRDSTTSCTDGVDNDFDHLADAKDPGCSKKPPGLDPLPPYKIVPKEDGYDLIKIRSGKFYTPDHPEYSNISYDKLYCSEREAREKGYKRAFINKRKSQGGGWYTE